MQETVFVRRPTPDPRDTSFRNKLKAIRYHLPDDVKHESAHRLGTFALVTIFLGWIILIVNHRIIGMNMDFYEWGVMVPMTILSAVMFWLSRRSVLSDDTLLNLAIPYEIICGFLIGMAVYRMPWPQDSMLPGWSPVSVWLLLFPMIVPNSWGRTKFATIMTALMDPLSLWVNVHRGLEYIPTTDQMASRFFPTVTAVFLVLFWAQVFYRMSQKLQEARELGSYQLRSLIGKGGMGEVWEAKHAMLARPAAVKLIRTEALGATGSESGQRVLGRFEREAQATAALHSPHSIVLYDFGTTKQGAFYYVMELLHGLDLATLITRFGPVPPERAVHLLLQACHSLDEAHAKGLVHRDIKPANLFTCAYGRDVDHIKVLDFGLVKMKGESGGEANAPTLTMEGLATGTPAFIPPEMAAAGEVDGRADIYGLGCVAYWLLTGQLVFEAESPMMMVAEHVKTPPTPPSQRTELEIPAELDRIILQCLAKNPADRPQTAAALARELRAVPGLRAWTGDDAHAWWKKNVPDLLVDL
ncbi:MAG: serine/threonine protein kinase [Gemmatimonadetes bacterium]|nr:serine/threonine protein kinase [Gemmatimonadota bacterium]